MSCYGVAPRHSEMLVENVSRRDQAGAPLGLRIELGVGTERGAEPRHADLPESSRRERVMTDLARVGHPDVFVPILRREWEEQPHDAAMRPGVPRNPIQSVPSYAVALLGTPVRP